MNLRYSGMSDTAKVTSWWIGTRLLTLVVALVGSWAAVSDSDSPFGGYVELWNQWDTRWFESIATEGYVGTYVSDFEDFRYNVAFFPGLPLLMRTAVFIGVPPVFIGIAVSLIAGWVAAMALLRLSQQVGGRGWLAPFAWIVAPTAVFLTAAYTEALFAAFAFWAWAMARERAWLAAGLLAGASAFVRPNAIFLTAGLAVLFVLSRPRTLRGWLGGWPLLLPIAVVLGYFAYLRSLTGSWTAWFDAQRDFWDRQLVDPVTSFMNTYELIFTFSPTGEPSSRMVSEIIAMGVLIAVVIASVIKRWWAESVYVLVTAVSLGTSSMYYSIPRTLILIFPLWILLGLWLERARWRPWAYGIVSIPSLAVITVLFTQGQWIS